jgi:hypothetical protein
LGPDRRVPLAAILWRNGIGFGGAVAFIFGDLMNAPSDHMVHHESTAGHGAATGS